MNLLILTPRVGVYSESFITNHIRYLAKAIGTWEVVRDIGFNKENILVINEEKFLSTYQLELKIKIYNFINKNKISHVLIEFGRCFSQFMELNIKELRLPTIIHFHGWDASKALKDVRTINYYKWLGKYANKFIVVSKKMKENFLRIGIPEEKIILNYYGIDYKKVKQKNYDKVNPKKCIFIFVGRFVPKKSPLNLLMAFYKALQIIKTKKISIELRMIGDTPPDFKNINLFSKCKNYVKQKNLENHVKFLGVLNHDNVLKELNLADVYVQHSITCPDTGDSEGLPNSIIEASLTGLPIVATYHAGIPEIIKHGINGFLVNENDIDTMANYMIKLAENINLRKEFGLNSIKLNKEKFSLENSLSKLKKYIEKEKFYLPEKDIINSLKEYYSLKNIK